MDQIQTRIQGSPVAVGPLVADVEGMGPVEKLSGPEGPEPALGRL